MSDLGKLLHTIRQAPPGPHTVAAFDLDGTLIAGYSASAVYRDRLRRFDVGVAELLQTTAAAIDTRLRGGDVDRLVEVAAAGLAGRLDDDMRDWGARLFRQELAAMIYPQARILIEAHRNAGHSIVLATSATDYQAEYLADDLGIDDILCTRLHVENGVLTGQVDGRPLWGTAKAEAVRAYARERGANPNDTFAYSNGGEDVPMLEAAGWPVALNPDRTLRARARIRGWPVVDLRAPRHGASPISSARTAAALSTLLGAGAAGLAAGVVTGSRRTAANLAGTVGPDLALAVAGIRLRVQGRENAQAARPAVFVFNHQSSLDMLVIGAIIRQDVTGVVKKEAARDPRFAPIGALLDVAYIDRSDSQRARAALDPAVDKLRSGISIAIAPEGTRSPTPRLGPFKKGAFHLAMQGQVPIVPIVIHDAGALMWRNSLVAHAGTVHATVLDPIPTVGWDAADLDAHVVEVREAFARTLAAGPG